MSRLAELQHGHVHLEQLRAAGIGRHALAARVRSGRLHRVLPNVYLVGRPRPSVLGRMMAAALYFRGDAVVSALAAAQAWGMLDTTQLLRSEGPVDVLLVGRSAGLVAGVRIHRVAALSRQDIRRRDGIPVTSPARTLLDLARTMNDLELEAALAAAFRERLVRRAQLEDVVERNPGVRGVAGLRALLAQPTALHDTRSVYERKLLKLLRDAELPLPITNVPLEGSVVDGLWPELKLVLEFDGWGYHRDRFESDRLRDQRMMVCGYRVMRITRRQIDLRPYALVARIASMIAMLRIGDQRGEASPSA